MNGQLRAWGRAVVVRAVKTWAQSAVALIGTNAASVTSLDWPQVLGASATAAVVSVLTSLAGLPEAGGDSVVAMAKEGSDED